MISQAHYDSREFVLDPAFSIHGCAPEEMILDCEPKWLYGQYECEAFLLDRMIDAKNEAKLKVGYTKNLRKVSPQAFFSTAVIVGGTIEFRAVGAVTVIFNDAVIFEAAPSGEVHTIHLENPGNLTVKLAVEDTAEDIPALLPLNVLDGWLYSADGNNFAEPVRRNQRTDALPPHKAVLPQIPLLPRQVSSTIWDAGVELLAYVDIECDTEPEMYVGESLAEAENNNAADDEQTFELVKTGDRVWTSKVPLAFRYIRIEGVVNPQVGLRALFHPVEYTGAFSMRDKRMTQIWMHSAYTLHLCMNNFLLDGIKRDRLPWAGDLAVSLMGNAYSFRDAQIVRDSLSVLGAAGIRDGHINDIADYSSWWLINHELYQIYYGDPEFLKREYPRITETLDILLAQRDERGFLKGDTGHHDFFFIDWVPGSKVTAVQILLVRALRAGAALADRMADSVRAESLRKEADKLAATINQLCFLPEKGLYASAPGGTEILRHANLLAVVTGMAPAGAEKTIAEMLKAHEVPALGTPYMSVFEALAIAMGGCFDDALKRIDEIWGGMLDFGATTFFEGFDPAHSGSEHYVFYARPFGKSLCHAWGAGPLFLLPQLFAGIKPASDGWKTFKFQPRPGLTCALAVPTPRGVIELVMEEGKVLKLTVPEGCKQV